MLRKGEAPLQVHKFGSKVGTDLQLLWREKNQTFIPLACFVFGFLWGKTWIAVTFLRRSNLRHIVGIEKAQKYGKLKNYGQRHFKIFFFQYPLKSRFLATFVTTLYRSFCPNKDFIQRLNLTLKSQICQIKLKNILKYLLRLPNEGENNFKKHDKYFIYLFRKLSRYRFIFRALRP